jgi:hypothetical protein
MGAVRGVCVCVCVCVYARARPFRRAGWWAAEHVGTMPLCGGFSSSDSYTHARGVEIQGCVLWAPGKYRRPMLLWLRHTPEGVCGGRTAYMAPWARLIGPEVTIHTVGALCCDFVALGNVTGQEQRQYMARRGKPCWMES